MFSAFEFVVVGLEAEGRAVGISRRGRLPSGAGGIVMPCGGVNWSAAHCFIGTAEVDQADMTLILNSDVLRDLGSRSPIRKRVQLSQSRATSASLYPSCAVM
jgi:hypothetical protein